MIAKTKYIATRESPLALWQATWVQQQLQSHYPDVNFELLPMTTQGDRLLSAPLATVGGKGLFLKELEHALLEKRADLAVHSLKDVTVDEPAGLCLAAYCQRGEVRDVFVSERYDTYQALPKGAIIGTSSLRRRCQLSAWWPDCSIKTLRGNVNTRLKKLADGEYDAIILAGAGLLRLNLSHKITQYLPEDKCMPAVGQGIMVVQCRQADEDTQAMLQCINDPSTKTCALAERAVNRILNGGCQVPIAAYATIEKAHLQLNAMVGSIDGKQRLYATGIGDCQQAEEIGERVAKDLNAQGAQAILKEVYHADKS